jgi:hypothetical protein
VQLVVLERNNVCALFGEGGTCKLNWRMVLFMNHLCTRMMGVAGEMQFLYISEA